MVSRLGVFLPLFLLAGTLPASPAPDLRIALVCDGALFASQSGSRFRGYDVDFLSSASRLAGFTPKFVPFSHIDDALAALRAGEIDAAAGVTRLQPASAQPGLEFVERYRTQELVAVVARESYRATPHDLDDVLISTAPAGGSSSFLTARGWPHTEDPSWPAAFARLASGEAEAVLCDRAIYDLFESRGLIGFPTRLLEPELHRDGVYLVTRSEFPHAGRLRDALVALGKTGHRQVLERRWNLPPAARETSRPTPPGFLALLGLLAAVLAVHHFCAPHCRVPRSAAPPHPFPAVLPRA